MGVLIFAFINTKAQLSFEHYTVDKTNLSQSTIEDMDRDQYGFMWFATYSGLNRFDGKDFTVFRNDPNDSHSISDSQLNCLLVDGFGKVWVGSEYGAIDVFDYSTENFMRLNNLQKEESGSINDLFLMGDKVLVATENEGVHVYDSKLALRENPKWLEKIPQTVTAITVHQSIQLIINTKNSLLSLNIETNELDTLLIGNRVNVVYSDGLELWVGTKRLGLFHFDSENKIVEHFDENKEGTNAFLGYDVISLYRCRDDKLLIGTNGMGLLVLNEITRELDQHIRDSQDESSLIDNHVLSIYEDEQDKLWIGTNYGLSVVRGQNRFQSIKFQDEVSRSLNWDIYSVLVDKEKNTWIGTWEDGLARFDEDGYKIYRSEIDGFDGFAIKSILQDQSETIWIAHDNGISRFNSALDKFESFDIAENTPIRYLLEKTEDEFWVATLKGLYIFDKKSESTYSILKLFDSSDSLAQLLTRTRVTHLFEDSNGILWASSADGLFKIDIENQLIQQLKFEKGNSDGLRDNLVLHVAEDKNGTLWVGTHAGISKLNKNTNEFYPLELSYAMAQQVVYDVIIRNETVWMSTDNGIASLDIPTNSVSNYDVRDGLLGNEFNNNASFQSSDGIVYFGGIRGLNYFDPNDFLFKPNNSPVLITELSVFDELQLPGESEIIEKSILDTDTIYLDNDYGVLSMKFAHLDFERPVKNVISYMMQGLSNEWVEVAYDNTATFMNLRKGIYTLVVRAANYEGILTTPKKKLVIIVAPAKWDTVGFKLTVVAALVLIVYIIIVIRLERINLHKSKLKLEVSARTQELVQKRNELFQKNKELNIKNAEIEDFTYTVSHDLKSPLITIKGFMGLIRKDAMNGEIQMLEKDLQHVGAAVDRMEILLQELLGLARLGRVEVSFSEVDMNKLAAEAVELVQGRAKEIGASIVVHDLPNTLGDYPRILQIIQNLLENSLKFMGNQQDPEISVGSATQDGFQYYFVQDNGIGIAEEYHKKVFGLFEQLDQSVDGTGMGLSFVKKIIDNHGGRIWIESNAEKGIKVCFTLTRPPAIQEPVDELI